MVKLIAVVAVEQNNGIGINNRLPWGRIQTDMDHFRRVTLGSTVIMGRKTWASIPGNKATRVKLPERDCVVMTRDDTWASEHATRAADAADAISYCTNRGIATAFVIGGAEVYRAFHKYLDAIHLTRIHDRYKCDTFFHRPLGMKLAVTNPSVKDEETGLLLDFEYWTR